MTLTFKVGKESELSSISLDSFDSFCDFLFSHEVGKLRNDPRIIGFWKEAYEELISKPLKMPMMFSRYRGKGISHLMIVEVDNQY